MKKTTTFTGLDGKKSLLELLVEQGHYIAAPCGGNGVCKKCTVIMNGTEVLSCEVYPSGDVEVEFEENNEDEMEILGGSKKASVGADFVPGRSCAVAIDLGTTTLAAMLVDSERGIILRTATRVNHQRAYGADVMARIQAAINGKGERLQRSIFDDIAALMEELGAVGLPAVIAGNTAMIHLLLGFDCSGLSTAPYEPVDLGPFVTKLPIYSDGSELKAIILPGIEAYIGADIVSGLCNLELDLGSRVCAMIDFGTNGEIIVSSGEKIMCASVAAGPAFEGGNISCGIAAVPGAVIKCEIVPAADEEKMRRKIADGMMTECYVNGAFAVGLKTVGNKPAKGVCGTGMIEVLSELKSAEIIDEMGRMDDDYTECGFTLAENENGTVVITQKDIRDFQMAKSAIRAGFEALLSEYGATHEGIDTLYLSGGFGSKIDVQKAANIGLFPADMQDITISAGNTSLLGVMLIVEMINGEGETCDEVFPEDILERMKKICETASVVELPRTKNFNDFFK
ncbi:MAG: DUF4445 domain-containing protein [Oscillospiraceae bacterium]|nr:DUF4445 domain-containing protein [Oscillospiraceae bacterium]